MVDNGVIQQSPNCGIGFARLGKRRFAHHATCIEGAERKNAPIQGRRNFVHIFRGLGRTLAHEDRVAGTIGIVAVMGDVIDQQERFAGLRVIQLDAAGKCRAPIGSHANGANGRKLGIAETDEMTERGGIEP